MAHRALAESTSHVLCSLQPPALHTLLRTVTTTACLQRFTPLAEPPVRPEGGQALNLHVFTVQLMCYSCSSFQIVYGSAASLPCHSTWLSVFNPAFSSLHSMCCHSSLVPLVCSVSGVLQPQYSAMESPAPVIP